VVRALQLKSPFQRCITLPTEESLANLAYLLHEQIHFRKRILIRFAEKAIAPAAVEAIYQKLIKTTPQTRMGACIMPS
jgi:hypothetical protein